MNITCTSEFEVHNSDTSIISPDSWRSIVQFKTKILLAFLHEVSFNIIRFLFYFRFREYEEIMFFKK